MDYITKNFLVISSIVTILAPSITIILLYSYLSVFNSSLIWVIEYSDVIKLSLLCIVIIASLTGVLLSCGILVYSGWFLDSKLARNSLIGVSAFIVIFAVVALVDIPNFEKLNFGKLIIPSLLSVVSVIIILHGIIILLKDWPNIIPLRWVAFLTLFIISSPMWGTTYGLLVKIDKKLLVDVKIRHSEPLTSVSLVIFLSHHTVFADGENVIVVPTSDVLRITGPQNKE
jgi:hypothetical protein